MSRNTFRARTAAPLTRPTVSTISLPGTESVVVMIIS